MANARASDRVLSPGRLPQDGKERVAFVSRLLVLATEARRRGALPADRFEQVAGLSGADDEERVRLLQTDEFHTTFDGNPDPRQLA